MNTLIARHLERQAAAKKRAQVEKKHFTNSPTAVSPTASPALPAKSKSPTIDVLT